MMGGNANAMNEVKPILESFGGNDIKDALCKAEELSSMLNAVQAMTGMGATHAKPSHGGNGGNCSGEFAQHGFPLAPISNIADENITYCLSRYIAMGE